MRPPIIISSHRGRIGVGIVVAVIIVLTVLNLIRSGLAGLTHLPTLLLFVWLLWIIWGIAEVRIDDDGVIIINQFRIGMCPGVGSPTQRDVGACPLPLSAVRTPKECASRGRSRRGPPRLVAQQPQ